MAAIVLDVLSTKRRGREQFQSFYTHAIMGKLSLKRQAYHGVAIQVENDAQEYVFYPHTDPDLNRDHIFFRSANVGDSIVKPAYSDTLRLRTRSNELFLYTFERIGSE